MERASLVNKLGRTLEINMIGRAGTLGGSAPSWQILTTSASRAALSRYRLMNLRGMGSHGSEVRAAYVMVAHARNLSHPALPSARATSGCAGRQLTILAAT